MEHTRVETSADWIKRQASPAISRLPADHERRIAVGHQSWDVFRAGLSSLLQFAPRVRASDADQAASAGDGRV